jgi:hypothetical protein
MKMLICSLLVYSAILSRGCEVSDITNNLYLAIQGWRDGSIVVETGKPIRPNDELVWAPFSVGSNVDLLYPYPESGIKIKMWGPDGKEVKKTDLGQSFGSKWDQLHSYLDNDPNHIGGITAWHGSHDSREIFTGPIIQSIDKLFEITKPGIYTLEIQMQMFRNPHSADTNNWSRNLFSFPPLNIKVQKP